MSREYVCNSCRKVITNPHEVKMKEFYLGCSFEVEGVFPTPSKRKVKVHLCDGCYLGLGKVAEGIKQNDIEVIRCKECFYQGRCEIEELLIHELNCNDPYCSYGERRENG